MIEGSDVTNTGKSRKLLMSLASLPCLASKA
jgi:hypothetical protein